jgi:uncharacterized ferritin-like protein (DUF455 family)
MRTMLPVSDLARDARFERVPLEDLIADPRSARSADAAPRSNRLTPARGVNVSDAARSLMHGIFTGEIQALEGAGRTCFDFTTGPGAAEVPFAMKLDMARQCWDEARHCEISIKLGDHMGTAIGEFSESTFLYEAACNADPAFRLCGVNRALEGLAIDVFNQMREFGRLAGDPVLEFCEDWMLADEVTHVKMGSDWLRRLTEHDPDRRARALEFQKVVDKLFSAGGFRSDSDDSPVNLARQFREMAGFTEAEVDEVAELARQSLTEAAETRREARLAANLALASPVGA